MRRQRFTWSDLRWRYVMMYKSQIIANNEYHKEMRPLRQGGADALRRDCPLVRVLRQEMGNDRAGSAEGT